MRRHSGFTLIEMMLAVAVIAILLAIAVPNLMRNRLQANESSAIEHLRVIASAEVSYNAAHQSFGTLANLADESVGPGTGFLSSEWTEGFQKAGYTFTMPLATDSNFICFADPIAQNVTGRRFFRVDASGIVRFSVAGQPNDTDTPIGSDQ